MNIVVVDDHWMVREGLCMWLSKQPDLHVLGEASDVQELLSLKVNDVVPDVVILDACLGEHSGLDAIQDIKARWPRIGVLVLSFLSEDPHAIRAIEHGADGYLEKGGSPAELVDAVRRVGCGRRYVSTRAASLLVDRLHNANDLTAREKEVVRFYALGYRSGQIARVLTLSPKTVSTHKANAMRKLSVHTNAGLIRWAIDQGLV